MDAVLAGKGDVMIKGADLLRTGVVLGVKLPIK